MALRHTEILFRRDDLAEVLGKMGEIAEATRDSKAHSWMNLKPWFDEDDNDMVWDPPLRKLFSARGPHVPFATWVPAHRKRNRTEPMVIGLTHPRGRYAVRQLAADGLQMPDTWHVRQDHSRRGIVIACDLDASCSEALEFLLDASVLLSGVELDGRWIGDIVEGF